jgi:hypothetical protein
MYFGKHRKYVPTWYGCMVLWRYYSSEVLCAAAGRLAVERSKDMSNLPKLHKTVFFCCV